MLISQKILYTHTIHQQLQLMALTAAINMINFANIPHIITYSSLHTVQMFPSRAIPFYLQIGIFKHTQHGNWL
jgi:hypothetical protein